MLGKDDDDDGGRWGAQSSDADELEEIAKK